MPIKPATQRVIEVLAAHGTIVEPREFAESTRTAAEAAAAIGTSVAQIVKSLIFLAGETPILLLVSGANRVDTAHLATIVGAPISRASAEIVRAATGYAIGGVPPVGHATTLSTYMDSDLLAFEDLWAAAGTPNSVFPITPAALQRITGAQIISVAPATG